MLALENYIEDRWYRSASGRIELYSAFDHAIVADTSTEGVDFAGVVHYARQVGGPALRRLTFHQRGEILKKLAQYLIERKDALYSLSHQTGATQKDNWIDIDGGIGTLFAYSSKARRELPNEKFVLEGAVEPLSKGGNFVGRHILTPLTGVAVFINAFNFPCWGMLEKFAPAFIAGMPVIVKPATITSYVTEAMVRLIIESGLLPPGALQLLVGNIGDLIANLTGQDVVSFTGSIETSLKLQNHPTIQRAAVRFIAERDSLNSAILGPDVKPDTPEFDLFVKEVAREMSAKAGQKCTAIRRAFVPADMYEAAALAITERLAKIRIGDPRRDDVTMGALVGLGQRDDVRGKIGILHSEAGIIFGDPAHCEVLGANEKTGAFLSPILLGCERPTEAPHIHQTEAFGPVATLMPYRDLSEAVALVAMGEGSLVASLFTYDDKAADELIFGIAPYHGRLLIVDRDCAKESTGHGSPLPMLLHGGPGRAGGGEEMGGVRGVFHYMQRTALQASPKRLSQLTHNWSKGAPEVTRAIHPFQRDFTALEIGETIRTRPRVITLDDIEHFADFTGDKFYAHMDEAAAKANPFFPGRVAHGYLLLSFAAGLFVEPSPGPVLANYGLDNLRFLKPVSPGESIAVRLTVKQKTPRTPEYGEVRWDVELTNNASEIVATYELLTMNALAYAT